MDYPKTVLTTFLLVCFAASSAGLAQQRIVEKTMEAGSNETVRMNLKFGESIVVKGWDRNEVSFRAVVEVNGGRLNDAFVANYIEDGRGIQITTDFDKERLEDGRPEDCPDYGGYSSYSWRKNGDSQVVCSNIIFEIYVPVNANLEMETIAADVELYDLEGPIDAKSISGFVDLSWPERKGANLSMKTISGEAYSDLDNLNFRNREGQFPLVGYELRGTIGGGGPSIRLESISGDIYLRKRTGAG